MEISQNRIDFHNYLKEVTGLSNIYFQPPSNIKLKYPCIVYDRLNIQNKPADNTVHITHVSYQVEVIDYSPDSEYVNKLSKIVKCKHNRAFQTEGLNHDVFEIYY